MARLIILVSIFELLIIIADTSSGRFYRFEPGVEYVYTEHADCELSKVGHFETKAKVGFVPISKTGDHQEIALTVYNYLFRQKPNGHQVDQGYDFSKWFSFVIHVDHGDIVKVYHALDEDDAILSMKKGLVTMVFGRFHRPHDREHPDIRSMEHDEATGRWKYTVQENGNEGLHDATYHAEATDEGVRFTKLRQGKHLVVTHADTNMTKILHYDQSQGLVSHVHFSEMFEAGKEPESFDPFENARKVKPQNEFVTMAIPTMMSFTNGTARMVSRNRLRGPRIFRPETGVTDGRIHVAPDSPRRPRVRSDPRAVMYLQGNLTCLSEEPKYGSEKGIMCFRNIKQIVESLPDVQFTKVMDGYFAWLRKKTLRSMFGLQSRMVQDSLNIIDVLALIEDERSESRLLKYAFGSNSAVTRRVFFHYFNKPAPEAFLVSLEQFCFQPETYSQLSRDQQTYHQALLLMGSQIRKLHSRGETERSERLAEKLENMLGIHDAHHYRSRRSILTKADALELDKRHMILIEALGNAALGRSFQHIRSYVNVSTVSMLKRAGLHALRRYDHSEAADMLFNAGTNENDRIIRHEAGLVYQRHPHYSKRSLPNGPGPKNGSHTIRYGVKPVYRARRDLMKTLLEGIDFDLEAPTVDYKKVLGSSTVGASYGLTMSNYLKLHVSLLKGSFELNIHDEVYASIHLGIVGTNIDFLLARVCFGGSIGYNLNILQEFSFKEIVEMITRFDKTINRIVGSIKRGLDLLNKIVNGEINIGDMFQKFIDELQALPDKVDDSTTKATNAMKELGEMIDIPPFLNRARNVIVRTANFYKEVKKDVMDFYNRLVETAAIIIPRAAKQIFHSVKMIINSIKHFLKSPKEAIGNVFKGIMNIKMAIVDFLDAKRRTMEACFFNNDQKPYWWDLRSVFVDMGKEIHQAFNDVESGGAEWLKETVSSAEDTLSKLTEGRLTQAEAKKMVLEKFKRILESLRQPFEPLGTIVSPFLEAYESVIDLIQQIKNAYMTLKRGYETARELIDKIFGPRTHKLFPKTTREKGGGCGGDGFFPSVLKARGVQEYSTGDGVDLLINQGAQIVAPFAGRIMLTENPNEVKLLPTDGSFSDVEIFVTNIRPNSTIQHPDNIDYKEVEVSAGQPIGVSSRSPCGVRRNHIHFVIKRLSGDVIDPTKYLEPRLMEIPEWISMCDEYKLVWLSDTIDAGTIAGLLGEGEQDLTPERADEPQPDMEAKDTNEPISPMEFSMRANAVSSYSKVNKEGEKGKEWLKKLGFPSLEGTSKSLLSKFRIRKLKIGKIISFLDKLGMAESAQKIGTVMKTIRDLIDNKPCMNPHQMADDQLRQELQDRGIRSTGSRSELIQRMTQSNPKCPFLQLKMPIKDIYCTFDENCLGFQCCLNVKVFVFNKAFKAYARLDPGNFEFVVGLENWKYSLRLPKEYQNVEKDFETGIRFNLLGDSVGVRMKLKLEVSKTDALVSLAVAVCPQVNQEIDERCVANVQLLENAVIKIPKTKPDGSLEFGKVDWGQFYDIESVMKRIGDKGTKAVIKVAFNKILQQLGIPKLVN